MSELTRWQVNLLEARERIFGEEAIGNDFGLMHAVFCHVGLPRSKPPGLTFQRRSGTASILIQAGQLYDGEQWVQHGLPYGAKPRLLLMHIAREYKRHRSLTINLGNGIRDFAMNVLKLDANGRSLQALRQQASCLAAAQIRIGYRDHEGNVHTQLEQPLTEFVTWDTTDHRSKQMGMFGAQVTITQSFADALQQFSVPINMVAVSVLKESALALDIYLWLAHRLRRVGVPTFIPWPALKEQFGQEYRTHKDFRATFLNALRDATTVYPGARIEVPSGGLTIYPGRAPIPE